MTPWLVLVAVSWLSGLGDGSLSLPASLSVALITFGALLGVWISGLNRGNNRLRSFGLGGLIAYLAAVPLSLLAVGACFVQFTNHGFN